MGKNSKRSKAKSDAARNHIDHELQKMNRRIDILLRMRPMNCGGMQHSDAVATMQEHFTFGHLSMFTINKTVEQERIRNSSAFARARFYKLQNAFIKDLKSGNISCHHGDNKDNIPAFFHTLDGGDALNGTLTAALQFGDAQGAVIHISATLQKDLFSQLSGNYVESMGLRMACDEPTQWARMRGYSTVASLYMFSNLFANVCTPTTSTSTVDTKKSLWEDSNTITSFLLTGSFDNALQIVNSMACRYHTVHNFCMGTDPLIADLATRGRGPKGTEDRPEAGRGEAEDQCVSGPLLPDQLIRKLHAGSPSDLQGIGLMVVPYDGAEVTPNMLFQVFKQASLGITRCSSLQLSLVGEDAKWKQILIAAWLDFQSSLELLNPN